jgi:predicted nucleic acid-binding protein
MPSSPICVDASVVVQALNEVPVVEVRATWQSWADDGQRLVAPLLLRSEVTNAFHRYRMAGEMTDECVRKALLAAFAIEITFYSDVQRHWEAVALVQRLMRPASYDAHYLALAERLSG